MPLEGQWERQTTPLRKLTQRERRVAIGGAVATFAGIVALTVSFAGRTEPPPGPGCIRTHIAGVMGGQELSACAGRAQRFCTQAAGDQDPNSIAIREACRSAGLL